MTQGPDAGPTVFVDLSNLCRDRRLLAPGQKADLSVLDIFRDAVQRNDQIAGGRVHCVADRSLLPLLPSEQRRAARSLEQLGELEFSALADERLLSLAEDAEANGRRSLVASMDFFDDFRRTFAFIQGTTDRFVGWEPDPTDGLRVFLRDMEVHDHRRLSRKEESAEFKARRLHRDSVVQRATAHYFRCPNSDCLVAQMWPNRLPDLPQFDEVSDQFVCWSCSGPVALGDERPQSVQLIVFLNGTEQVRLVVDEGAAIDIGRQHGDGCFGLQPALGREATSAVSRRHLRFHVNDGSVLVEDLGSRNGTVLRDKSGDVPLSAGSRRRIGRHDTIALPAGVTIELSGRSAPFGDEAHKESPAAGVTDRSTRLLGRTLR